VRSRDGSGALAGGLTPPAPTGRPHRWQKRARAERSAWQASQVRAVRLAPQALQKLPVAGVPQAGQGVGDDAVMAGEA
jgi:hypothetical protein